MRCQFTVATHARPGCNPPSPVKPRWGGRVAGGGERLRRMETRQFIPSNPPRKSWKGNEKGGRGARAGGRAPKNAAATRFPGTCLKGSGCGDAGRARRESRSGRAEEAAATNRVRVRAGSEVSPPLSAFPRASVGTSTDRQASRKRGCPRGLCPGRCGRPSLGYLAAAKTRVLKFGVSGPSRTAGERWREEALKEGGRRCQQGSVTLPSPSAGLFSFAPCLPQATAAGAAAVGRLR